MLRIFLAAILCLTATLSYSATPETLEQINADLLAKKTKAESFKDKEVKVDLESLGLDEIDAKDSKTKAAEEKTGAVTAPPLSSSDEVKKSELEKSKLIAPSEAETKPNSLQDKVNSARSFIGSAPAKIQSFLQKTDENKSKKDDEQKNNVDKKSSDTAESLVSKAPTAIGDNAAKINDPRVNTQKKLNLKKHLAAKKAAKKKAEENEKKRKDKLAKLNQLREKYLVKINSNKVSRDQNLDEDLSDSDEKIVPQKKDINKFVSYETPAPPILNRYRSPDNKGIPVFLSNREKADILFKSIGEEDISYFNSAFNGIENPDLCNYIGDTILTYAILLQKREVVASILAKGANPDLANALGYTPLQITIEIQDLVSFNLLVNDNANINAADGFGRTYLMHAARVGFLPAIDILIKKGADVNALDYDGFSALAIANKYKQDLAIALLLKNGAKPWVEKPYEPESESMIKQLENRWRKN